MHLNSNDWRSRNQQRKPSVVTFGDFLGDGDVTRDIECLSMETADEVQVPRLSYFSIAGKAIAGEAVGVGEAVSSPGDIPENYSSDYAYLEVLSGILTISWSAHITKYLFMAFTHHRVVVTGHLK